MFISSSYLEAIIIKRGDFIMFKKKQLFMGMLAGVLISMPFHMYANDLRTKVETWATPYVQFIFDDQITPLPLGYTVLNYEGRTYVPTRFVAEQLGAEVGWDEGTQTISIKSKPVEESTPEQENQDNEQGKDTDEKQKDEEPKEKIEYSKLPLKKTHKDFAVTLTSVFRDNNSTRIYIELENKQHRPVQVRQMSATLITENKTYTLNTTGILDERLFRDAMEDDFLEGYLAFPKISEDIKEATVKFEVIYNDGSEDKHELEYNIKF